MLGNVHGHYFRKVEDHLWEGKHEPKPIPQTNRDSEESTPEFYFAKKFKKTT